MVAKKYSRNDITVISKDGEVTVHLSLDININMTGEGMAIQAKAAVDGVTEEDEADETHWAIPDFKGIADKLKFGKNIEE